MQPEDRVLVETASSDIKHAQHTINNKTTALLTKYRTRKVLNVRYVLEESVSVPSTSNTRDTDADLEDGATEGPYT